MRVRRLLRAGWFARGKACYDQSPLKLETYNTAYGDQRLYGLARAVRLQGSLQYKGEYRDTYPTITYFIPSTINRGTRIT